MESLYSARQSREIDQSVIKDTPVDGYQLMCRAGAVCLDHLMAYRPALRRVIAYAGSGNNGGDAYVTARLLHKAGVWVRVVPVAEPKDLRNQAAQAYADYVNAGGELTGMPDAQSLAADVVVDGIFGSGLSRPLSEDLCAVIAAINKSPAKRFAIDIPSGLNADTGCPMPVAVAADTTLSLMTRKQGLYTGAAKDFCGKLIFDSLQVRVKDFAAPAVHLINYSDCKHFFTPRKADTHKGMFGRLLIVGGDYGMAGAVCLAGIAALRAGAGLVICATRPEYAHYIGSIHPELMTCAVSAAAELDSALQRATALVLGPGLGRSSWSESLFDKVAEYNLPIIADADALRILSRKKKFPELKNWVLTPHPGEAAALLGLSTLQVQADRFAALAALDSRYAAAPILKGAGTLIATDKGTMVCSGGNAGMSSAGMGDVLSGILGGLIAQGMPSADAAIAAVCIHAEAGDHAAGTKPYGLIASDLFPFIRTCVNFLAASED